MNDVVIQKVQSIQRCILRARGELESAGEHFADNFSRQDAAILNVTRACEQAIDLANHIVKKERLGIPTSSSEVFVLLANQKIISNELSMHMKKMTGFQNLAVHQYQALNIDTVRSVIISGMDELLNFTQSILKHQRNSPS